MAGEARGRKTCTWRGPCGKKRTRDAQVTRARRMARSQQTKPKARAFSAVLQAILGRALVDVARPCLLYARQGCNAEGLEVKAAKTISGDRRANHLRGHLAHLSFMVARVFLLVAQIRHDLRRGSLHWLGPWRRSRYWVPRLPAGVVLPRLEPRQDMTVLGSALLRLGNGTRERAARNGSSRGAPTCKYTRGVTACDSVYSLG